MPFNQTMSEVTAEQIVDLAQDAPDISALKQKIEISPNQLFLHYKLLSRLIELGNLEAAHSQIDCILQIDSKDIFAFASLGHLFIQRKRNVEAIHAYEKVIQHGQLALETLKNQIKILKKRGKRKQISDIKLKIDVIRGFVIVALSNCGALYHERGSTKKGLQALSEALTIDPNFEDANLNIGVIYEETLEPIKAITAFENVLKINPNNKMACLGMGNALKATKQYDTAILYLQRAIKLDPGFSDALVNLGTCFLELGNTYEAIDCNERAIKYNPTHVKAWSNLGSAYSDLGNISQADHCYNEALKIDPDNARIIKNKSLSLMKGYQFSMGLKTYDYRWMEKDILDNFLVTDKPIWNLEEGHRVFLWAEQGLGDELMFATMFREVIPLCSEVIIQADIRLHDLFRRSFGKHIKLLSRLETLDQCAYDYHLPIGSLMNFFLQPNDTLDIPQLPYLVVDKDNARRIRDNILGESCDQLIGISWKTQNIHKGIIRSLDLDTFFKSVSTQNRTFVSLQYGDVSNEIHSLFNTHGVKLIEYNAVNNFSDIDGLAALIAACDSVISTTNTTVHLAAAQGKNCNVLIPAAGDWRWGIDSTKSYWYKSVTLHRNSYGGDWSLALKSASDAARLVSTTL